MKYIFANWKMYLDYDQSNLLANSIANEFKIKPAKIKMAIFPSALAIYPVAQVLNDVGIAVGCQNGFIENKGAYTGEISYSMFREIGCEYTLIGHSERRHIFGETDVEVRLKIEAAIQAKLTPVVCVGETKNERVSGLTDQVIKNQLTIAYKNLKISPKQKIFIAYEPVWAIGTGDDCSPDEASRVQHMIKKIMTKLLPKNKIIILYGGSVNAGNIQAYLNTTNIEGVLVGTASYNLDSWRHLVKVVK